MSDWREGLEGLQADMAEHQRRFGANGEVTAEANRSIAVAEVERWDRQQSDEGADPAPSATSESDESMPGDGLLEVASDNQPFLRPVQERTERLIRRISERVDLLMTKRDSGPLGQPSWRDQVLAILYWRMRSAEFWRAGDRARANDLERRYMCELRDLLDRSNHFFGDWRRDPEPKLIVEVRAP